MKRGGVQLMPTATTRLQSAAVWMHSSQESPFTTCTPSLEFKEIQAGIGRAGSSSKTLTTACSTQSEERGREGGESLSVNKRIELIVRCWTRCRAQICQFVRCRQGREAVDCTELPKSLIFEGQKGKTAKRQLNGCDLS